MMNTKHILIVEDHEPTRNILRRLFNRRGWQVTAAGTVAEGLFFMAQEPPPNCLLLDLDLPDGHGESVLRRVREERLPVRVAVCSGTGDRRRWGEVRWLSPEALLHKPIDMADVCSAFA